MILQDNKLAMLIEENVRASYSKRTRHLNIRHFYAKDTVDRREVEIAHCPTEIMLADFFAKSLQRSLF